MTLTSIDKDHFLERNWKWSFPFFLSRPNEVHKNWVLFPEKIRGKFAILHALTPEIMVDYVDSLDDVRLNPIKSNNNRGGRKGAWDGFVRGAGAPPLKTRYGWLLLYHAMTPGENVGYKIGAMLLDLDDPTKILYRSAYPILEPKEWYENEWKAGVVYASGAVIKDDNLFVYYGGGDKHINVATAPLEDFLHKLMRGEHAVLSTPKTEAPMLQ